MKNKYTLMGQCVEVKTYMKARKKFSTRSYTPIVLKKPRVGMVVGYRTVYEGEIKPGFGKGYFSDPSDYNPSHFIPEKTIKVLLVCFWPTYNPVLVKPEDIIGSIFPPRKGIYNLRPTVCKWTKASREDLRKIMITIPRDKRGRWLRKTYLQK